MQPRWKDGSKGMLTVNALFAGFSAVLLINLTTRERQGAVPDVAIWMAVIALFCFAFAAERITDALDEGKVRVYVASMVIYNIGVINAFWTLTLILHGNGRPILSTIVGLLALYPWGKDVMVMARRSKREDYIAKLLVTE